MLTEQVNFRIDSETKKEAEAVFLKIGVSATEAARMFYKQVVMRQGLPFNVVVTQPDLLQGKSFEDKADAFIEAHKTTLEGLSNR
jgi:addiction module RelB/DinJ family antitoxin